MPNQIDRNAADLQRIRRNFQRMATMLGGGTSIVTSVGLSLPSAIFNVAGSPVTSSGTFSVTLNTQSANTVFRGPTSGAAAVPTFGALVTADLANQMVTYAKLQNVSATDKVLGRQTAGAGVVEEITCTAAGRDLLDDANAATQRTTLGLGTMATQDASNVAITGGTLTGVSNVAMTTTGSGVWFSLTTSAGKRYFEFKNGNTDANPVSQCILWDGTTTRGFFTGSATGLTLRGDNAIGFQSGATTKMTMSATDLTLVDAFNLVFNTTTGTKIGTATTQKIGFFNATPVVQPANTTDLRTALINLGLYATGGATPLNLNGGALTCASITLDAQTANRVFAGPTTGVAASPTFRALVAADMPATVALTNVANVFSLTNTFSTGIIVGPDGSGLAITSAPSTSIAIRPADSTSGAASQVSITAGGLTTGTGNGADVQINGGEGGSTNGNGGNVVLNGGNGTGTGDGGGIQLVPGAGSPNGIITFSGSTLVDGNLRTSQAAAATVLGSVVKRLQIFDAAGTSLGYIPIYNTIT